MAMAINRQVVVNLYGGRALGTPLCHLLPDGLAGSRGLPVRSPQAPGARWSAPDLAQAHGRWLGRERHGGDAGDADRVRIGMWSRSMGIYLQSVLARYRL